jgi:flagellar capping protein FliD
MTTDVDWSLINKSLPEIQAEQRSTRERFVELRSTLETLRDRIAENEAHMDIRFNGLDAQLSALHNQLARLFGKDS